MDENAMEELKKKIRTIPDFPKPGIMFRDITTLLKDGEGLREAADTFLARYRPMRIDLVAGIESRGFILGGLLAYELGVGFVPLRKKGKLPAETAAVQYELEYGTDTIEAHVDAISAGDRVLLVDDLIATGGTAAAACELIEALGGEIVECAFIIELPALGGRQRLGGRRVYTLVLFEGE